MFKFDLKHRCYQINKLVPQIFFENWKKLAILFSQYLPVGLDEARFCLEKLFML